MTYKHDKFDDSPVMRSLEKVARDKGWVESKQITKSASTKLNLKPSSNLTDNILKLCSGLKAAGLDKYATDIENKFVAYKQAATMYDTHGETGEDLIHAAHPKGSHHLEGLDDAVVKTILDKHLDMVNMVNKKPTGKLSNASDILNEVKVVLGGSFLSSGRANGTRKIAQDKPVESSTGADIAGTVGGTAAVGGLGWLFNKLRGPKGVDREVLDAFKEGMKRNPTKLELKSLLDQSSKVGQKAALEKVFGTESALAIERAALQKAENSVAGTAAKGVGSSLVRNIPGVGRELVAPVEKAVLQQGAGAVAKSSGVWSKLVGLVGSAGSAASAAGATSIGGGTLSVTSPIAGLSGAGAAGAGALGAAVLIGAIGGVIAGNALFDHFYSASDLKEAGQKLIGEAQDVKDDFPEYKYVDAFERVLNQISAKYGVLGKLKSGEPLTVTSLNEMKEINDLIMQSNKLAQTIWSYAMDHKDEQTLGFLRGFGDVVVVAKNYMEISAKVTNAFDDFARDATRAAQEKVKEQSAKEEVKELENKGGPASTALYNSYTLAQNRISKMRAKISAKELKNEPALNAYLDKISNYITSQKSKFDTANENKEVVVPDYKSRLDTIVIPKLDEFESLYGK